MAQSHIIQLAIPEHISPTNDGNRQRSRGVEAMNYRGRQFVKAYVKRDDLIRIRMLSLLLDVPTSVLIRFVCLQICDAIMKDMSAEELDDLRTRAIEEIDYADKQCNG